MLILCWFYLKEEGKQNEYKCYNISYEMNNVMVIFDYFRSI